MSGGFTLTYVNQAGNRRRIRFERKAPGGWDRVVEELSGGELSTMTKYDYKNETDLRELYVEKKMTTGEIAEELDCSQSTVLRWLDNHGIEKRTRNDYARDQYPELRGDGEQLRKLYVDKGLSYSEIADKVGCSQRTVMEWIHKHDIQPDHSNYKQRHPLFDNSEELRRLYQDEEMSAADIGDQIGRAESTVQHWLDKYDIEQRERNWKITKLQYTSPVYFWTDSNGYERWQGEASGERFNVGVHRLLAVSKYGLEEVSGNDVHHTNEIPWDNRPDNIELMSHEEHSSHHHSGKTVDREKDDQGRFVSE